MVFLQKILLTLVLFNQWQGSGPEGGFVRAIAAGSNVGYAYTDQGLFRCGSDAVWKRIETPNLNLMKEGGVNQLALLGDFLFACTRQHGLIISMDSGVTWQNAPGGIPVNAEVVGIVMANTSNIFVATRNQGIWKYNDSTSSFYQPAGWEFAGSQIAAIGATQMVGGYAAVAIENERIIRIWRPITNNNWDDTTSILNALGGKILSLGWNPQASAIYVGTSEGFASVSFSSLNYNHSWSADVTYPERLIRKIYPYLGQLFAGTNKGILRGEAWSEVNSGLASLDVYTMDSPLLGSLFAGASDGVYQYNGAGWDVYGNLRAQTFTGLEVDPQYPKTCFVTSNGGGFYKSPDGCLSWKRWGLAEFTSGLWLSSSRGAGSNVFLYAGNATGIAVSKNGGEEWVQHPDSLGRSVICVAASLAVPEECWFVTIQNFPTADTFVVWHSTNACESGTEVYDLQAEAPRDMAYSPLDRKMFLLTGTSLYRSNTSGGVEKVPTALPATNGIQLEAGGGGRLFMLGSTGKIYSCSNAGEVWKNVPGPSTTGIVKRIAADTSSSSFLVAAVASGSELSVFVTSDTGNTWTRIAAVLPGEVQELEAVVLGELGHVYLATPAGVSYAQFQVSSQPSDLILTITPEAGSFQPEIGANAIFNLGGDDISKVTSWSVVVRDTAGNEIFSQSASSAPPALVQWDGFTASGWLPPSGIYTATFSGQTGQGGVSGKADASVNLIIANPPLATSTDATAGSRLLLQYPQTGGDLGNLYYRSRDVPELFAVSYNSAGEGSFFYGQGISNSRDVKTALACIAMAQDGSNWHTWVDVTTSGQTYVLAQHSVPDYSVDTVASFIQDTTIVNAAIVVAADSTPLIALVRKTSSGETGELYHRSSGAWVLDTVFSVTGTDAVSDIDAVRASDGVHVFFCRGSSGYDLFWNGAGTLAPMDTTEGAVTLSAASLGDDKIYLVYTDGSGKLFFKERASNAWGTALELDRGSTGPASNVSCNVNASGKVTVAWQAAGAVYYNQRTGTLWGEPQLQTPLGSAFFPQLPQCTYSSSQPLIAWTEGTSRPYFVRIVPLGESPPPDTIILTMYSPQSLTQGNVLQIDLKTQRTVDSLKVHLENIETADEYWPGYRFPDQDSTSYDTLTATFADTSTENWPAGQYRVIAEAHLGGISAKVEDTLEVTSVEPDTTVLVDPAEVFFLPNPAVRQGTAKIYYNLSVDATAVEIEIYTARGKNISNYETSDLGAVSAGVRKFLEIDISGLGSDVYFFRFTATDDSLEAVTVIKPFVVVK